MIPSSRLVPTSLNKGRPVVLDEAGSEVSHAIRQLAHRFTGMADESGDTGSVAPETAPAASKKKKGLFAKKA